MHIYLLWIATAISFITFYIHTFIGQSRVVKPLLKHTDLAIASRWLNYYCWHITTIYTFCMGFAYLYVAINPEKPELVVFLSILNTAFAILSALVACKARINPLRFPSTSLFAAVSLCGILWLLLQ